jgi:putative tryptophan/tyrosine transport system substrate-binding protein
MLGAVTAAKAAGAEALRIVGDTIFYSPPNRVPALAAQAGLPSIYLGPQPCAGRRIDFLGPDFPDEARRGAHYVRSNTEGRQAGRATN